MWADRSTGKVAFEMAEIFEGATAEPAGGNMCQEDKLEMVSKLQDLIAR